MGTSTVRLVMPPRRALPTMSRDALEGCRLDGIVWSIRPAPMEGCSDAFVDGGGQLDESEDPGTCAERSESLSGVCRRAEQCVRHVTAV